MCFGTRFYKARGLFNKQDFFFTLGLFLSCVLHSALHSVAPILPSLVVESNNSSSGRRIHEKPLGGKFLERSSNLKLTDVQIHRRWARVKAPAQPSSHCELWQASTPPPATGGSRWADGSMCESDRPSPWQPQARGAQDCLQQLQAKDAAVRRGLVRGASLECWQLESYSERIDLCHCSLFFFFSAKNASSGRWCFPKRSKIGPDTDHALVANLKRLWNLSLIKFRNCFF